MRTNMNRRSFLTAVLAQSAGARLLGQTPGRAAAPALPVFVDVSGKCGVSFKNEASHTQAKYLVETMLGGVAMFDYNGDGRLDLFFVNGAALANLDPHGKGPDKSDPRYWNRLYRNNGDGTFTDVTEQAGVRGHSYGMGAAVGDYDNDGHPDLYVTNYGRNILYHNNGDGTFTDVTDKAGVAGGGWSVGACWVDYDRDGHLDLIVSRYLTWDYATERKCGENVKRYCDPFDYSAITHLVYHNNGDGTFTDVSKQCGIGATPGQGLGIAFNDYDHDGWPDIFIANDQRPEQLFHNRGDGTFEEVALSAGVAFEENGRTFAGMGVDFEDYDNDGWPDILVDGLAYDSYSLFRNVHGSFEYVSGPIGLSRLSRLHSGWGIKLIDYDNDGWKDLFVVQSHVMDNIEATMPSLHYKEPPMLLRNRRGRFTDVSAQSGEIFSVPMAARGAAFGDLDNDGFIDVAINVNEGNAVILHNQGGNGNHWIMINTVGTVSNRDGIGAQLHVVSESGFEQYRQVTTAGSYLSACDKRAHFGLGSDRTVRLLEITWPSGIVQKLENIPADQILTVKEPSK
jgi:hypothetical protein